MNLSIDSIIELEDEFDRESFFEDYIAEQTNINYLNGFREGIKQKKDICKSQKNYYISLVDERIFRLINY